MGSVLEYTAFPGRRFRGTCPTGYVLRSLNVTTQTVESRFDSCAPRLHTSSVERG
jgi:hypothetical protein